MLATVSAAQIKNKLFFLRVDFNVPLKKNAAGLIEVADDRRIQASLRTLEFLLKHQARVLIASHLGRPKLEKTTFTVVETQKSRTLIKTSWECSISDQDLSLSPIATYLQKKFHLPVQFAPNCLGAETQTAIDQLKPGSALLLENLRFYPAEKKNLPGFAEVLSHGATVYLNESFSNSHRSHASMVSVPQVIKAAGGTVGIGFGVQQEVDYLEKLMVNPKKPFVVIVGGAKISDKVTALQVLSQKADIVLVGGGVANNFLKALGLKIFKSYIQDMPIDQAKEHTDYVQVAQSLIEEHKAERWLAEGTWPLPKILAPIDVVAATDMNSTQTTLIDLTHQILDSSTEQKLMYLDIGPKTTELFCQIIAQAGTVFWNGPMGVFEQPPFATGTKKVAQALADSSTIKIIGGGDTVRAVEMFKVGSKMDYISTGGGAALEFLGGQPMPGLAAVGYTAPNLESKS